MNQRLSYKQNHLGSPGSMDQCAWKRNPDNWLSFINGKRLGTFEEICEPFHASLVVFLNSLSLFDYARSRDKNGSSYLLLTRH